MRYLLLILFLGTIFAAETPTAEAPKAERIEVWGTVIQVLEKGLLVMPKTNSNIFLLVGHPDQETLTDNAVIIVWAEPAGRFQYAGAGGSIRTVQKLKFLEKSKNVYYGH